MTISCVTKLKIPDERGIGYATFEKARAFQEVGADTELITPRRLTPFGDPWKYYQMEKNAFTLVKLSCLELSKISFLEVIFRHWRYFILSWSFSLAALIYLWKGKRKVVHFYLDCKELLILLKFVVPFYRPVVVVEAHFRPQNWYEGFLEKIALSRVDLLLTTTHSLAKEYKRKGFNRKRIKVMPEGVRLEDFDYKTPKTKLRKKLNLAVGKIIIGYAGRFRTAGMEKGLGELIAAVAEVKKKYENIFLVCVGGLAEDVRYYQTLLEKSGLGKNGQVLGHVDRKILYRYLRIFDICVFPFPWTDHFAFNMSPLKMFESMASKNPIVATDLPSIKEVLTHKKNAYLVKPGDPESLAKGIEYLIKNKRVGQKLARQAFAEVAQKYTWKTRAAKILNYVYDYEVNSYLVG